MCGREREIQESYIVSISSTSQRQDYMALFCLRACHCPCMGFNFNPLSTSATQLLPTAIYYRQIERFQGVSQFVLALNVQAGYLHSLSPFLYASRTPACPPSGSVRAVAIVTKSSGKRKRERGKKGIAAFPKQRGRMAVVPLVDPQASSLEAYRLTSVKA